MGTRRRSSGAVLDRGSAWTGRRDASRLVADLPDVVAAERLAALLLAGDRDRLRHVRTAAASALLVCDTVAREDVVLLLCATVLHDIGYSPAVRSSGFHPFDGGCWLLTEGAPATVAGAVARHSESLLQPGAVAFPVDPAALPAAPGPVADAITYADLTTTPDGRRTTVLDRLVARGGCRHPTDAAAGERDRLRTERLAHAVARVEVRMARLGSDLPSVLVPGVPSPLEDPEVVRAVDAVRLDHPGLEAADGLGGSDRVAAAVLAGHVVRLARPSERHGDLAATAARVLGGFVPTS